MGKHELPGVVSDALAGVTDLGLRKKLTAQLFNEGGEVELNSEGEFVKRRKLNEVQPQELPRGHKIIYVQGMAGKGSGQPVWKELQIVEKTNAGRSGRAFRGIPSETPQTKKERFPVIIDASVLLQTDGDWADECQQVVKMASGKKVDIYLSSSIVGEWDRVSGRHKHISLRDRILGIYSRAVICEPTEEKDYVPDDPTDNKYVNLLAELIKIKRGLGILLSMDPHITRVPDRHPDFMNHIFHPKSFLADVMNK